MIKIICYHAKVKKLDLDELIKIGEYYADNIVIIALAATSCNFPGQLLKPDGIKNDELELGLDTHVEPDGMVIKFIIS